MNKEGTEYGAALSVSLGTRIRERATMSSPPQRALGPLLVPPNTRDFSPHSGIRGADRGSSSGAGSKHRTLVYGGAEVVTAIARLS